MAKSRVTIKTYKPMDIDRIATKATSDGIYTVESMLYGIRYFFEEDEVVIANTRGCMSLSMDNAKVLADELRDLLEDVKSIRREGRKILGSREINEMLKEDYS